ncbi:hypothetical protein AU106_gp198 [Sinorhizobium phage phiM9]|uniref:Uncharacterized protein n=1 Tax=Sinorhizobium phage phiM9 TaxID=1636182 RepID=A0A0F6TH73_9CAUD|nr:hypothetical protein AU106_gp198 [Sinorhizobium phage phiM9]AKE44829.1 hypothetical protein Sm_phiM9_202 [Sinorhizobium phage phiM9]
MRSAAFGVIVGIFAVVLTSCIPDRGQCLESQKEWSTGKKKRRAARHGYTLETAPSNYTKDLCVKWEFPDGRGGK